VNVVTGSVARDATVLIEGSRIWAVGKSHSVQIPAGARVVNVRGGYLVPGLWDMHVHTDGEKRALVLMLAAGITGVRDMGGDAAKLAEARRQTEAGNWDAPTLIFSGPLLDGPPGESDSSSWIISTPEEGRQAVARLAALHVDFIKVHDRLGRDTYFSIAAAAKEKKLPFAGHVPASITPEEASDAGQVSIEHFEFLPKACSLVSIAVDAYAAPDACGPVSIAALFKHFAARGTWLDPTVQSFRYFAPQQWKSIYKGFSKVGAQMRSEQVRLLAGTDWSDFLESRGALPGSCLHDELELWVAAGFTPLQALQAATLNPALFLGMQDSLGTIDEGKMANLLILQANPLQNVRNTRQIMAVIKNGVLYEKARLRALTTNARYKPEN
jgi:imidazolonepropionase-like amidohydrolase